MSDDVKRINNVGTSPICPNLAHWAFDENDRLYIKMPEDSTLECPNQDCRCKSRKKEIEGLDAE